MAAYRKKPVVVDAIRYDGPAEVVLGWIDQWGNPAQLVSAWESDDGVVISTLEGEMTARPGWWVIRGVAGEFYPCEPTIFEQTYEPAS